MSSGHLPTAPNSASSVLRRLNDVSDAASIHAAKTLVREHKNRFHFGAGIDSERWVASVQEDGTDDTDSTGRGTPTSGSGRSPARFTGQALGASPQYSVATGTVERKVLARGKSMTDKGPIGSRLRPLAHKRASEGDGTGTVPGLLQSVAEGDSTPDGSSDRVHSADDHDNVAQIHTDDDIDISIDGREREVSAETHRRVPTMADLGSTGEVFDGHKLDAVTPVRTRSSLERLPPEDAALLVT